MEENFSSLVAETIQHYWKIGNKLATTCPAASRYFIFNLEKKLSYDYKGLRNEEKELKKGNRYCNYCGLFWAPGNHKVKILPPPKTNSHIKKLLKVEANEPWKLNGHQKKKLQKYREATSKIVYMCTVCKKSTTYPGLKKSNRGKTTFSQFTYKKPLPKIKSIKKDLGAGLFIPSTTDKDLPEELKSSNKNNETPSSLKTSIHETPNPVSNCKTDNSSMTQTTEKKRPMNQINLIRTKYAMPSPSPKIQESIGHKKKSLLAKIKTPVCEEKKKKSTLASFLVSL